MANKLSGVYDLGIMKRALTPSEIVIRGEILRRLAEGESLREICDTEGFPHESTVRMWARDEAEPEGFSTQYARARQIGYDALAEEMLAVARGQRVGTIRKVVRKVLEVQGVPVEGSEEVEETTTESDAVDARRLHVDTLKWQLSKMLPKVYGDKIAHEVGGIDGKPIQTESVNVVVPLDPVEASRLYLKTMENRE